MVPGFLFGLVAMIAFGLGNALSKAPVNQIGAARTVFFRNFFTSAFLLAVVFLAPAKQVTIFDLGFAGAVSLLGYLPLAFFYRALKVEKVGIVSPIANSNALVTIAFSVVFLNEILSVAEGFWIVVILTGIVLVSLDINTEKKKSLGNVSGLHFAVLAMFFWGLVFFLLKIQVSVIGPFLAAFVLDFVIFVSSGAHVFLLKESFRLPDRKTLFGIFVVAVLGVVGLLAYSIGLGFSQVSLIAGLYSANGLVSAAYGKFFLKEKLSTRQYFAIGVIIAGVFMLSYLSAG